MHPTVPDTKKPSEGTTGSVEETRGGGSNRKVLRRGLLSLRFKFLLWVISLVMYLCLALGYLFVRVTERNVHEELGRRGASIGQLLAHKSCPHILRGDLEALEILARAAVQDEDVVYAAVLNTDGIPLVITGLGGELSETSGQPLFKPTAETSPEPESASDIIEVTVPVTYEMATAWSLAGSTLQLESVPSVVATVILGMSTTREGRAVAMVSRQLAPLIFVSCILSIIGTLLAERKITKPVEELARATKAIASGDLTLRIKTRSNDEFGQLAQSFNQMADALSTTLDKLENYSHGLEDKVRVRTDELEAKTRALQQANAELQKLDSMKSGFVSNVSHELRTPLTSIKAIAEILGKQGQSLPRERTLEFLGIIENQTDRLTRLIGDILDLSRLEHGDSAPELQPISLHDAVSESLGSVRGLAEDRHVNLSANIPQDLPDVLALAGKIEQVLVNLLGNALKFTPAGGSISVDVCRLNEEVTWRNSPRPVSGIVVAVADTGTGIPQEKLDAVFDKFRQIENAAWGKPSGSGLGLSISKELVERLGGTIWAESALGKGSTFYFTLKPAEATAPAANDPPHSKEIS
jgi:signal transduction histidine kinase